MRILPSVLKVFTFSTIPNPGQEVNCFDHVLHHLVELLPGESRILGGVDVVDAGKLHVFDKKNLMGIASFTFFSGNNQTEGGTELNSGTYPVLACSSAIRLEFVVTSRSAWLAK